MNNNERDIIIDKLLAIVIWTAIGLLFAGAALKG